MKNKMLFPLLVVATCGMMYCIAFHEERSRANALQAQIDSYKIAEKSNLIKYTKQLEDFKVLFKSIDSLKRTRITN